MKTIKHARVARSVRLGLATALFAALAACGGGDAGGVDEIVHMSIRSSCLDRHDCRGTWNFEVTVSDGLEQIRPTGRVTMAVVSTGRVIGEAVLSASEDLYASTTTLTVPVGAVGLTEPIAIGYSGDANFEPELPDDQRMTMCKWLGSCPH